MTKKSRYSLQSRFTLTLSGVAIFIAVLVGLFGQYINERLEVEIWRATLESEFSYFKENTSLYSDNVNILTGNLRVFRYIRGAPQNQSVPAIFYQLEPGIYDEIKINDKEYCVLVRDLDKDRVLLAYDITHLEHKEFKLGVVIFGVVILSIIFIVYISHILGGKLVAPIKRLADRLSSLNPEDRGLSVGDEYEDSELSVIAQAIDYYLARLDTYVDREREFLDTASHELRTPITVISGAVDVLTSAQSKTEINRRVLSRIKQATSDMTETINVLFVLAKDSTQIANSAKPFQVDSLIEKIINEDLSAFPDTNKKIQLLLDSTCIFAPEGPSSIIFRNLIRNAIEHSVGMHVFVELKSGIFTIKNEGSSINPDKIATLFNKRVRGENNEGSGLGLYLIKRICESLNWTIEIMVTENNKFLVMIDLSKHVIKEDT